MKDIFHICIRAAVICILIFGHGTRTCAFSIEDERELGKKFMELISKEERFIADKEIAGYVSELGKRIVAQTGYQPFDCKFYVINSPQLNAFAAPAGQVFIYSGLIVMLENEGELASIISHEMGHVTARHIAKNIEKSKVLNWLTLAGALAGVFLGKGTDAGAALTTSSIAAGVSLNLKYSRENEREADQLGLKFLTKAGYDSKYTIEAFKKLRKHDLIGPETPQYLSTHPDLDERIIEMEQQMMFVPDSPNSHKEVENSDFRRVKTLLMAKYSEPQIAVNRLNLELRSHPDDFFVLYGLGLAYKRADQMDKALQSFNAASKLNPDKSYILREVGICSLYTGDLNSAITSLQKAVASDPDDQTAFYYLARSYQLNGDRNGALNIYEELDTDGFGSVVPGIHYNLGIIYGQKGLLGPAHYHLGLFFKSKGERENALYHLNQALNFYQKDPDKQREIRRKIAELNRDTPKFPRKF